MLARLVVAFAIAITISLTARQARALNLSGTAIATLIGTLALLAGWKWGILLLLYFVSSSAMSRIGSDKKALLTSGVVEKGGERDAVQVLANGGVFALAAAMSVVAPEQYVRWIALGVGALAASASDTWATEIGTLVGRTPRSIVSFAPVSPGVSGGVTLAGTFAAIGAAAFISLLAIVLAWPTSVAIAAFVGGIVGSTFDSLLGATLQLRRRCDRCGRQTERAIHDCGAPTRRTGGIAWLRNDAVNLISGAVGGLVALGLVG
jgi:uncharacterized protein (TIGR00297 family)